VYRANPSLNPYKKGYFILTYLKNYGRFINMENYSGEQIKFFVHGVIAKKLLPYKAVVATIYNGDTEEIKKLRDNIDFDTRKIVNFLTSNSPMSLKLYLHLMELFESRKVYIPTDIEDYVKKNYKVMLP